MSLAHKQRPQLYLVPKVPGTRLCLVVAIIVIVISAVVGFPEVAGTTIFTHAVLASMWTCMGPGEGFTRYLRALAWILPQGYALILGLLIPRAFDVDALTINPLAGFMVIWTLGVFIWTLFGLGVLQVCVLPFSFWWRIDHPAQADGTHVWQFKMRHLLIATTIMAGLLGLGRFLSAGAPQANFNQVFPAVLLLGTFMLPAIVLLPVLRSPSLQHGLIAVAVLLAPVLLLEVSWEFMRDWKDPGPRFLFIPTIHGTCIAWSLAMGILWRRGGLRFVYYTERMRHAEDVSRKDSVSFDFLDQPVDPPQPQ